MAALARAAATVGAASSATKLVDMRDVSAPRNTASDAGEVTRAEAGVVVEVAWWWESDHCDNQQAVLPISRHEISEPATTS